MVLIELHRPDGVKRDFDYDTAQRVLTMPKNGGWFLPEESTHFLDGERLLVKESTKKARAKKSEED